MKRTKLIVFLGLLIGGLLLWLSLPGRRIAVDTPSPTPATTALEEQLPAHPAPHRHSSAERSAQTPATEESPARAAQVLALQRSLLANPPSEAAALSSFTLDRTEAEIVTSEGTQPLRSSEGLFDRTEIPLGEPVQFKVRIPETIAGQPLSIHAIEGGLIEREGGPLHFIPREGGPVELALRFTPTLGRGRYVIAIRHGGSSALIPFWAGPLPPSGEAGPPLALTPASPEPAALP